MNFDVSRCLSNTPYNLESAPAIALGKELHEIHDRVATLRSRGQLTRATLERYYGNTRYEQVAESNAIEGSPLTVPETKLAVLKGTTLTGLDPGYVRDAQSLNKALERLFVMASDPAPLEILQVKELHGIILEGRYGAGSFRNEPVTIVGSTHKPPRDWKAVMDEMEKLEAWSLQNEKIDPILRGVVLHAWFAHIHPFIDGNGRTARAITNLELIRNGYPSIIIRRNQDRDRYIDALRESDYGGDISQMADLVIERFHGALLGLEQAAKEVEGYDPATQKIRLAQQRNLNVWNSSVELLFQVLRVRLEPMLENVGGKLNAHVYRGTLSLDEYVHLCKMETLAKSWAFKIEINVPGLGNLERLAWIGFQNADLRHYLSGKAASPTLYWSQPNPERFPPWLQSFDDAPGVCAMTITPGEGDAWHTIDSNSNFKTLSTTQLAQTIADGMVKLLSS
ncbi:MAG: Fic family protein [Verrucomicrobiota bacterium]